MNSSNIQERIPVLVIFAPTAAGKTALLRNLFGEGSPYFFKGRAEIISADSMQVYRGMDIGTAKPDLLLQKELPHHLIDICNPDEQFSASQFIQKASECCGKLHERGKIPVVAGGTGFYIKSFLLGLPETPPGDSGIRALLVKRAENEGLPVLYEELKKIDAAAALKIHKNDAYRIERALEIFLCTGRPLSSFAVPRTLRSGFDFCTLVLARSREELYRRIDERVDSMFSSGLAMEFNSLVQAGYTSSSPGMAAIGYRELFSAFTNGIPFLPGGTLGAQDSLKLEKVKDEIKKNSRHYAKKQYTIMKDIPGAAFCPLDSGKDSSVTALQKISDFMKLNT